MCFELQIRFEDLKPLRALSTMTTLDKDDVLRKEAKRLQAEKKKRMDEYKALINQEHALCDKLVVKRSEVRMHVPSEGEIHALIKRVDELHKLYEERKREMNSLKAEIVSLHDDLEISQSDSFTEQLIFEKIEDITVGEKDVQRARDFRDSLVRKNNEIIDQIRSLRSRIKDLWSKLNIEITSDMKMLQQMVYEEVEIHAPELFPKRHIVNELTTEYERCHRIKMENMQKFVEGIRCDIKVLMDKMFLVGDDHMQFLLSSDDFNEELLAQHEKQLEELRFLYDENQDMYEKMRKWSEVWDEYVAFEEKTKDPQRFKQRGYNMLEEERQRKAFKIQLPKLEEDIVANANEYAEAHDGQSFCIFGMPYQQFIEHKKTVYEESKLNER
jgi:protein regulator of cytokinesis 1